MKRYYINPPLSCDVCSTKFKTVMYDAKTSQGPWANMCEECFSMYGIGLGVGLGQKYVYDTKVSRWYKV